MQLLTVLTVFVYAVLGHAATFNVVVGSSGNPAFDPGFITGALNGDTINFFLYALSRPVSNIH